MIDYEKIAASTQVEEKIIPPEQVAEAQQLCRPVAPLDDPRYQGLATAKGYSQRMGRIGKVKYRHEAMIEEIIKNPTITQRELAQIFGTSEAWISTVYGSDAFQASLARRRDELLDPLVVASIEERFKGLVHQSISVLAEKLEITRNPDLALKALDVGSKALGFGARTAGGGNQNNQFIIQLPPKSDSAQTWNAQYNPDNIKQLPSSENHA